MIDVTIFHLDEKSNLIEKIVAEKANIKDNDWILNKGKIFKPLDGILTGEIFENYQISSIYNFDKINSLF